MDDSLKSRLAEFLNVEQVEELRSIPGEGGVDLFSDVATLFLRTTPDLLGKMAASLQAGETEALAKQAHMLKGSSSNLGAFRLSEKSHRMEQGALKKDPGLDVLFGEIAEDYVQLQSLLEDILKEPPLAT